MDATPPPTAASLPRRLLALLATAFAVLALAAACGRDQPLPAGHAPPLTPRSTPRSTPAKTAPARTVIRTFSAFRADGRAAVPVARTVSGNCFTTSAAAPATRAYRCFAGNLILDPCFAPRSGATHRLLCVADPWAAAVGLRVRDLPTATRSASSSARPWAFELVGGLRCVAATGTVPSVGGVDLPYRCTTARTHAPSTPVSAALLRAVSAAPTLVSVHAPVGARRLTRTPVRVLWRG